LKAPDGIALKASYFSPGRPGPGILLLHQCNQDRTSWTELASKAAARGYHVLALDYRGYGESEGQRFEDFQEQQPVIVQKWPGDIDAAFDWLIRKEGVDRDRIAAAGASCGVNQSLLAARRHPEVKTVVLLSGNATPEAREYLRDTPGLPVFAAASVDDGNAVTGMKWILGWSRNKDNKFVEFKAAGHGTDMFAVEKGLSRRSSTGSTQSCAPRPRFCRSRLRRRNRRQQRNSGPRSRRRAASSARGRCSKPAAQETLRSCCSLKPKRTFTGTR
jgi:dienelactone hydrolase